MQNKESNSGWHDTVKHPIIMWALIIFIGLLIILFATAIFSGYSVKLWGIEIAPPKSISDTVLVKSRDTITKLVEKPTYIEKGEPKKQNRRPATTFKQGDSISIMTNSPTNINTGSGTQNNIGTNQGVISENTYIINPGKKRTFTDEWKRNFVKNIKEHLIKNNKPLDYLVRVMYLQGDQEAYESAKILYDTLEREGFSLGYFSFFGTDSFEGIKISMWADCLVVVVGHSDI